MRSQKISFIVIVSIVLLGILSWVAYSLWKNFRQPEADPYSALPENVALIIRINHPLSLWEENLDANPMLDKLALLPDIRLLKEDLGRLDSIFRKDEKLVNLGKTSTLVIALAPAGANTLGVLFLASFPGSNTPEMIREWLLQTYGSRASIVTTPYGSTTLYRLKLDNQPSPFYFSVFKGVFLGSVHSNLVRTALDRLSLNTSSVSLTGFTRIEPYTGKKVDANIYINYRYISLLLNDLFSTGPNARIPAFASFGDWSGLDMIIKKDELIVNGFSTPGESTNYLSLLDDQAPFTTDVLRVLPATTSWFMLIGLEDPEKFYHQYRLRNIQDPEAIPESQKMLDELNFEFQFDLPDFFLPWMNHQVCLFSVTEQPRDTSRAIFTAIQVNDSARAIEAMHSLVSILKCKWDSVIYKGIPLYKADFPDFLYALFGNPFRNASLHCFTIRDGYFFAAARPDDLKKILDHLEEGSVLLKEKGFADFSEDIQVRSNLFYYLRTPGGFSQIRQSLRDKLARDIESGFDTLKKFEHMAIQFSNNNGIFYTLAAVRYNPHLAEEGPLIWQAALDTTIVAGPQLVHTDVNHVNPALIVTDASNNMYLVDRNGQIRWKTRLFERLMSPVYEIRMNGSDSAFYIFSTAFHLYLLRPDGSFADRYPLRFPLKATNGILVTDFSHTHDYRIMVALADNRIYDFDISGRSVEGWQFPRAVKEIRLPLQNLKLNGKDMIFYHTKDGEMGIIDRRGKTVRIAGETGLAGHSLIHQNKTNRKGYALTTNSYGKVIYLQEKGKIQEVTFNLFTADHYFFYEDMNQDRSFEFIFVDKGNIYYYDRFNKLVYSFPTRREIVNAPRIYKPGKDQTYLGLVSSATSEVFLFGRNGKVDLEEGIHGNTDFEIGYITSSDNLNLVIGSGKILKNYRLSKSKFLAR